MLDERIELALLLTTEDAEETTFKSIESIEVAPVSVIKAPMLDNEIEVATPSLVGVAREVTIHGSEGELATGKNAAQPGPAGLGTLCGDAKPEDTKVMATQVNECILPCKVTSGFTTKIELEQIQIMESCLIL